MSTAVLARGAIQRERSRTGASRVDAERSVARKLGIAPGTVYNLARDRLKRVDHAIRDRLVQYAIRDLEAEIAERRHELELARQMGAPPHSDVVLRAQALLASAQALYSEATGVR